MRTSVASSSIEAYSQIKGTHLTTMHERILKKMQHGVLYTRRQLARMTGMETSTIAGRVNELISMGQVVVCAKVKCPISNKSVESIKRADKQLGLF